MRMPMWFNNSRWFNSVRIVLIGWMLAGLSLLLEPVLFVSVNPALNNSVCWVKIMISFGITIGSSLLLLSRFKWPHISTSWRIEIVGLHLLVVGWSFYTVAIIVYDGWALFPIFLGLAFTLACIERFFELLQQAALTRKNVEHLPEVRDV